VVNGPIPVISQSVNQSPESIEIRKQRFAIAAMLLVAAVAFAFYAPSLRFGFFNDDPTGHLRWMQGRSVWSLLTDASGHSYYRPLSFIFWQILYALLGRHDPFVLHLLNVLAHAANAALVVWLAHRLTGRWLYATLAGLLFALYPFSYEAVPYVGSFVHPLVTLLILLTLAFYIRWREGSVRWAFAAAHVTLTLAVLTQENAVITPLLMLALSLLHLASPPALLPGRDKRVRFHTSAERGAITPAALSFLIEPMIFAAIWLLVPKTAEARTISFAAMKANVLPFVQALVYPVAPLANHRVTLLALLAIASLAILFMLARYASVTRVFAFGLIVWALASLPSILILDNAYVLGSPRLFYLASAGAALVCALPLLALESLLKFETWYLKFGIWFLTFALCYLPSASYTRCELAYQGMAGEVGRMMAGAAQSTSQELTFVNLPYFFSSRGKGTECHNPFVFAPTGAVVIPPYADARDFVVYNGGPDRPTIALVVPEYRPGWQTFGAPISVEQLREQLDTSRVFVFDLIHWRFFDLSAAWQPNAPMSQARATLGKSQISSLKSQISNSGVVTLTWQSLAAAQDLKVFVHVYAANGKLAAQDDGPPAAGFAPTSWWRLGDVITDTRTINVASLPPGTYRITAGMYDGTTGERLEARGADGARLPDDEILIAQMTR
jgi:hypothetical protein